MSDQGVAAEAQMLIRRPADAVFNAFVDPAVTTKFWFTRSTGRLEPGAHVQWTWDMYDATADIEVLVVEPYKHIVIAWPYGPNATQTTVEWNFQPVAADRTFVTVVNSGFSGTPEEVCQQAVGSTGGFSLVLAGAKALLEHNVMLNLVADHAPPEIRGS